MVGDFNGCNPKLYTEKLAGGVKACLGFVKTHRAEYVPNTVLNTDIRTVTKNFTAGNRYISSKKFSFPLSGISL